MNITFILPGPGNVPVGGFKIVYEYANRLAERGHAIVIVHQALRRLDRSFLHRSWRRLRYWERLVSKSYRPDGWFRLRRDVRVVWVPTPEASYVPAGDVVVATSWETAEAVAEYPVQNGSKAYLIQHHEVWSGERARVEATWSFPLRKVVISSWLQNELHRKGEASELIQNALDTEEFGADIGPSDRNPYCVVMPYHRAEWKGTADGLHAIRALRKKYPAIELHMFGVEKRPRSIPHWARYQRNPGRAALRAMYNDAAVFVGPSWDEGWGLPASEAMLCGAAAAITNNRGHREFARDGINALLSTPRNPSLLAENVERLFRDDQLRVRVAKQAVQDMKAYDWRKSVAKMEAFLLNVMANGNAG